MPSEVPPFQIKGTDLNAIQNRDPRYPMKVAINGQEHEMAFFEWYTWELNGSREVFAQSQNMDLLAQSWQEMQAAVPDACLIVAYFPNAQHIYLPYLKPEHHEQIVREARRVISEPEGPLQQVVEPITYGALLENLSNQRDAIAERAAEEGVIFFDLTTVLQAAAAQGEILYYKYDTHWNQRGHEVVGRAIAEFVARQPCARQQLAEQREAGAE